MVAAPENPLIHVVDDDDQFRASMARLLSAAAYRVRTYGSTGEFLLNDIADAPGCLLLDFHLPGPSGLDLQSTLLRRDIPLPIVFLSGRGDVPVAVQAMKAGAVDFLTKPVSREQLLAAVAKALALDAEARAARERLEQWRKRYGTLTAREIQVFERVVTGLMNKVIADELGIAERTVKAHRARLMEKMGASSLAELVHIAEQLHVETVPSPDAPAAA